MLSSFSVSVAPSTSQIISAGPLSPGQLFERLDLFLTTSGAVTLTLSLAFCDTRPRALADISSGQLFASLVSVPVSTAVAPFRYVFAPWYRATKSGVLGLSLTLGAGAATLLGVASFVVRPPRLIPDVR